MIAITLLKFHLVITFLLLRNGKLVM